MAGGSLVFAMNVTLAMEPARELKQDRCEDPVDGVATIVPKLDCPLFKTTKTSYQWEIVEHDDGHLENTFGGRITAEDLLRIEHTADCTSTHQGKHKMEFCDAVATGDGVKLCLSGGMPAYASGLSVTINRKLEFKCSFAAVYPGPTGPLHWKITKKAMKLKSAGLESRSRLRGWLSVEFEETDESAQETHAYKIEGYFKPVIQTSQAGEPAEQEQEPSTGGYRYMRMAATGLQENVFDGNGQATTIVFAKESNAEAIFLLRKITGLEGVSGTKGKGLIR